MGQVVVTGGTAQCTFGTLPGMIAAGAQKKVLIDGKPVATIMDFNTQCITPFGLCTTLTNPAVQASSVGSTHAAAVHARTRGNMEAHQGYCSGRGESGADE